MSTYDERFNDRRDRSAFNYGQALGLLKQLRERMTLEERAILDGIVEAEKKILDEIFADAGGDK